MLRLLFVLATEHTLLRMFLNIYFRKTCISIQLSVEPFILSMRSATPSTHERQLPAWLSLITGRIQLDCLDRSVYSQT